MKILLCSTVLAGLTPFFILFRVLLTKSSGYPFQWHILKRLSSSIFSVSFCWNLFLPCWTRFACKTSCEFLGYGCETLVPDSLALVLIHRPLRTSICGSSHQCVREEKIPLVFHFHGELDPVEIVIDCCLCLCSIRASIMIKVLSPYLVQVFSCLG